MDVKEEDKGAPAVEVKDESAAANGDDRNAAKEEEGKKKDTDSEEKKPSPPPKEQQEEEEKDPGEDVADKDKMQVDSEVKEGGDTANAVEDGEEDKKKEEEDAKMEADKKDDDPVKTEQDEDNKDDPVKTKDNTDANKETETDATPTPANVKAAKDLSLVEQAELAAMNESGGPAPPDAVRPKNNDILFGRGKPFQNHPGNRKMLQLIDQYKQQYTESPRDRKRPIVEEIIGMLAADEGRFLKRYNEDVNSTWWVEVSKQVAFDKVSHAFRSRGRPKSDRNSGHHGATGQMPHHGMPGVPMGAHPHHHHHHHPYGMGMGMGMNHPSAMMAAMGRGMNPMMAAAAAARGFPPGGGRGGGGGGHQFNPSEMEQFQNQMFLEQQRRAAALGFGNPAALYGPGFAGHPGDGGFGLPGAGGYPPHPMHGGAPGGMHPPPAHPAEGEERPPNSGNDAGGPMTDKPEEGQESSAAAATGDAGNEQQQQQQQQQGESSEGNDPGAAAGSGEDNAGGENTGQPGAPGQEQPRPEGGYDTYV